MSDAPGPEESRPPRPRHSDRSRPRSDDGPPRREQSVKSRLRAKARKKARKRTRKMFVRRKMCRFCVDKVERIDHKDARALRVFITETGKMIPRRISGNCARHQREMATAIKRARILAILPFTEQGL